MSIGRQIWKLRALVALTLPLLLTACASGGSHHRLVREYEEGQESRYARQALAAPAGAAAQMATDDFLVEVEATLLASRQRWEAKLAPAEASAPPGPYAGLAASPERDARLADGIELAMLEALVDQLNPGVAAARRNLLATLEQYPQAAYLDDILRQYNAFTKQLDTAIGPRQHQQMQAMQFPFPDTLALKGRIVDEEVAIAERQVEIARRDALVAVRTAYYGLLFVDDAIAINRENQQLLEQMIEVAQSRIRTGQGKYHAVVMAQVELSKLADAIVTLEEEREVLETRLNALLSRPAEAPFGPPQPVTDTQLTLALDDLYPAIVESRQELQQQRLRISRMTTMVELADRMATPEPTLGNSYFEDRMRLSSGTGEAPPAFMANRPLNATQATWFGLRSAYIQEVEVRIGALEKMLTEMEDQTRLMVKQAHFGLDRALRSIALYRHSLLPQAEQALAAADAAYRAGETDFITFLDAERTWLRFRLEEQRAWRDYRVSQAKLDQLAGQRLPRAPFVLPPEATRDNEMEGGQ